MRRFSCMYCGQEISAPQEMVGRRAKCPACGHSVLVYREPRDGPRSSASSENADALPEKGRSWTDRTNQEIMSELLVHKRSPEEERRRERIRGVSRSLASYDDLTLFALSGSLLLLLAVNPDARRVILAACSLPRVGVYVVLAVAGMVLSFLNTFVGRRKSDVEKRLMLLFAVLAITGTGACSAYVAWKTSPV